ncbi:EscD/YscD/HrpQ family type III secretion system inner membrane ring protein [Parashewanella curva]|uniref:EscD/YscD/HrpQ family type III secretion system inner membrane ring protein n=1 Tax=Parashewanella curva TaxID=2338552 RepID=A0A3L8PWU7_9GAMM|nr:type III secretion system inner membrane ring subunit SctD [Parashewanella curva]RLV59790.1 EscD/YscD/HrpQ family type III secretion system inner membrane ring protein [Parashewanella curva]
MPSKFKILWLNGPLSGRQLVIPEGTFTVGEDGDVLAVLDKLKLIEFDVNEEKVELITQTPVWIDGIKPDETITEIPLGSVIEIEGIAFILGLSSEEIQKKAIPKRKLTKKRASNLLLIGLSAFSALLILALLVDPVEAPQHEVTPQEWVSQRLTLNELDGIKALWSDNGVVTFNGFCDDSRKLAQFIEEVKNHGILFVEHAECTDQLVTDVRQVLGQNGFKNVTVTQDPTPGSVTITGAIQAGEEWDKAVKMLKGISGLMSWHVLNQSGVQLQTLIDELRKKDLLANLMLTQLDEAIVITGEVDRKVEEKVMKAARALKPIQQNGIKLVFQNIPVRNEVNRILTSAIVSFGGSHDDPFIELENGVRLSQGSEIDNGYVIKFIDINGIDLSKSGQVIHIPLLL